MSAVDESESGGFVSLLSELMSVSRVVNLSGVPPDLPLFLCLLLIFPKSYFSSLCFETAGAVSCFTTLVIIIDDTK